MWDCNYDTGSPATVRAQNCPIYCQRECTADCEGSTDPNCYNSCYTDCFNTCTCYDGCYGVCTPDCIAQVRQECCTGFCCDSQRIRCCVKFDTSGGIGGITFPWMDDDFSNWMEYLEYSGGLTSYCSCSAWNRECFEPMQMCDTDCAAITGNDCPVKCSLLRLGNDLRLQLNKEETQLDLYYQAKDMIEGCCELPVDQRLGCVTEAAGIYSQISEVE